jgi:uncharacterized damage-inducible protein DinB
MDSEIQALSTQIRRTLSRIREVLEGLTDTRLNWRPPISGSNSVYAIAAHTLGNARAWVLGIACGYPMGRDRPGEFASSGPNAATLIADAARLSDEIEAALSALAPSDLDRRLMPLAILWGEGEPQEITVREALLHVVEHAALHLGQIQLTRDLALKED